VTEEEWARVQEALVKGGLRECIDNIIIDNILPEHAEAK
jgi:hypothetical protein